MSYILEDIAVFVPKGRNVRLTLLPEKPVDCWVLSETRIDVDESSLNVGDNVYFSSYINVYCRQSPNNNSTYSTIINDLKSFYSVLCGRINSNVGDNYIMDVKDFECLPLGRDDKGNYLVSLNFVIDYV